MSEDRGQALLVAAILIGIGALAIVGLRAAQDRVLANALAEDAGEAAVQAAAAVIADAYVEHLASQLCHVFDVPRPTPDVAGVLASAATREAARAAATEAASANGAAFIGIVEARCVGPTIEVELSHAGRRHRAAIAADTCSPR